MTATVRDIMQTPVRTVTADTTVRELVRLLSDEGIGGVPVVTADGRLLGVVSATDVLRMAADELEIGVPSRAAPGREEEEESGDEEADLERYLWAGSLPGMPLEAQIDEIPETSMDRVTVGEIMTPAVFDVRPDTTLPELADFLLRGRIHRAVVVEEGRLAGIVTTFDVLRAVAGTTGREELSLSSTC